MTKEKNFYKDNEGYKKLKETLFPLDEAHNLTQVVADAISFGMDRISEAHSEAHREVLK